MSKFVLSPEADEDVWRIWQYLSEQSGVTAASRIEAELFHAFTTLAGMPGIGYLRADLTSHPAIFSRCNPL